MNIDFCKYQGTGNDFIIICNPQGKINLDNSQIKFLCDRRFGVGADGLMILKLVENFDFEMEYYNANGKIGTMCGNGGRCITAFAKRIGLIKNKATFLASDGVHHAFIYENDEVKLKMINVTNVYESDEYFFANTGSPHYVEFVENADNVDVINRGREIRYSDRFKDGTNVNFVSETDEGIYIRTYERGVEDETLSCGTGSVASAISFYLKHKPEYKEIIIKTKGGNLKISFEFKNNEFKNIYLEGAAEFVFSGSIEV